MKSYADNELEQTFYYFWENQKLMGYIVKDATGSDKYIVKMLYDNSDDSIGYELYDSAENETETMYFQKNLQGDITGVYNFNYGELLTYTYDAWGNVTVENPTFSVDQVISTVDALLYTPITYRGYMYDVYTGLYYLQSRYYNPAYGRFLNTDSIMQIGEPLGANIFAYCGNNPVSYVDYDGRDALQIIKNILYLLVVLLVMDNDNLVDRFDYIFMGAKSFSLKTSTTEGITNIIATFVHCSSEDEFESYDINIKLAHIDVWRDWQRNMEHASYDNNFADVFLSSAFFLVGFLGFPGQLISATITFAEIYHFVQQKETYKYVDFIHEKINNAKQKNLDIIFFVREIKRNYTNLWGNIKSETIYDCVEG